MNIKERDGDEEEEGAKGDIKIQLDSWRDIQLCWYMFFLPTSMQQN